jgi:hypothetical protein
MPFAAAGAVTGIGSLPLTSIPSAIRSVVEFSPEVPFWPIRFDKIGPWAGCFWDSSCATGLLDLAGWLHPQDIGDFVGNR